MMMAQKKIYNSKNGVTSMPQISWDDMSFCPFSSPVPGGLLQDIHANKSRGLILIVICSSKYSWVARHIITKKGDLTEIF